VTTLADSTDPNGTKVSRRRSLDVEYGSPATKSFVAMADALLPDTGCRSDRAARVGGAVTSPHTGTTLPGGRYLNVRGAGAPHGDSAKRIGHRPGGPDGVRVSGCSESRYRARWVTKGAGRHAPLASMRSRPRTQLARRIWMMRSVPPARNRPSAPQWAP